MENAEEPMLEAAETLIIFSLSPVIGQLPDISDLWPSNPPIPAMDLETIPSLLLPSWGLRLKRSRCSCVLKSEREKDRAAETLSSPATPLDFGYTSMPSTSGSDEGPSSPHDSSIPFDEVSRKEGKIIGRSASAGGAMMISSSKQPPMSRVHGKKMMIVQLRAQERLLADENSMLRKRVESKRKEMNCLIAENRRLLQCEKSSFRHCRAAIEAEKPLFFLPDLNEPANPGAIGFGGGKHRRMKAVIGMMVELQVSLDQRWD